MQMELLMRFSILENEVNLTVALRYLRYRKKTPKSPYIYVKEIEIDISGN